jgi:hypothetical protein
MSDSIRYSTAIEDNDDEETTEDVETTSDDDAARFEAILRETGYVRTCFTSTRRQITFVVRWTEKLQRELSSQLLVDVKGAITAFKAEPTPAAWTAIDTSLLHMEEAIEARAA